MIAMAMEAKTKTLSPFDADEPFVEFVLAGGSSGCDEFSTRCSHHVVFWKRLANNFRGRLLAEFSWLFASWRKQLASIRCLNELIPDDGCTDAGKYFTAVAQQCSQHSSALQVIESDAFHITIIAATEFYFERGFRLWVGDQKIDHNTVTATLSARPLQIGFACLLVWLRYPLRKTHAAQAFVSVNREYVPKSWECES